MVDARVSAAAMDNARWCHLVCSIDGISGRFDTDAWTSPTRTPEMYPDAVTLRPGVSADDLLVRIDPSPGASVKDSFADLDMSAAGFDILFDATWIAGPDARILAAAADHTRLRWETVADPDDLVAWSNVHGAGATFGPALLDDHAVTILAGRDPVGNLRAGAVASAFDTAVGISNVFAVPVGPGGDSDPPDGDGPAAITAVYLGATGAIAARYPGRPLVGYESGDDLRAALAAGFERIGPLRIWLRGAS
jgi:hypothetical protein